MFSIRNILRSVAAAAGLAGALLAGPVLAQETLTLLTWNAPQNEPMFRAWIDSFKKDHPGVEIEWLDKTGSDWATFYQAQLVGGTPPDIINVQGTLWAEYAANDYVMDLTPYLEKNPEVRARFSEGMLGYWTLGGQVYGLPYYVNKSLLYYNKLLFEKAGIDGPPKTVDELLDAAEKIAALSDETTGFVTLNFDWLYWSLFASAGVEMFNDDMSEAAFNTPEMLERLTKLAAATKSGAINNIAWTGRWREPNGAFASGNVGMYQAHGGAYYNFRKMGDWINADTVGATEFPGGIGVFNSHGFLVSKATANPDLAWAFVEHITSPEWAIGTARRITRTVGQPEIDETLLAELKDSDPVGYNVMDAQRSSLDKLTATWNSPLDSKIKEAFWPELQSALLGQKDPKAALDDAERKVNRVLSRGR